MLVSTRKYFKLIMNCQTASSKLRISKQLKTFDVNFHSERVFFSVFALISANDNNRVIYYGRNRNDINFSPPSYLDVGLRSTFYLHFVSIEFQCCCFFDFFFPFPFVLLFFFISKHLKCVWTKHSSMHPISNKFERFLMFASFKKLQHQHWTILFLNAHWIEFDFSIVDTLWNFSVGMFRCGCGWSCVIWIRHCQTVTNTENLWRKKNEMSAKAYKPHKKLNKTVNKRHSNEKLDFVDSKLNGIETRDGHLSAAVYAKKNINDCMGEMIERREKKGKLRKE